MLEPYRNFTGVSEAGPAVAKRFI